MRRTVVTLVGAVLGVVLLGVVAWALTVTSRSGSTAGIGEVVVNNVIVLRIRTATGGYSAQQRADIIAQRVRNVGDYKPDEVTIRVISGLPTVFIKGQSINAADRAQATANKMTTARLAEIWRNNFRAAVGGTAEPEVATSSKVVPLLSVGSGLRIGLAMVSGESGQVGQVKAVAQIEGDFNNKIRIRAMVPIGKEDVTGKIERTPRTNVTAYVDIKL